jgi:hypothetical protein
MFFSAALKTWRNCLKIDHGIQTKRTEKIYWLEKVERNSSQFNGVDIKEKWHTGVPSDQSVGITVFFDR